MVQTAVKVVVVDGKSDEATEINCQNHSRGGLSYEVILAERVLNVTVPKRPVIPGKNVSAVEIEQKLKAAEERRVSLEQKKMTDLTNKLAKIKEAKLKKDAITNEFINQIKEQLKSKMEHYVEKRDAIFSDLKKKMKIDLQELEKLEVLETMFEKVAIEGKLKSALSLHDDYIDKMLERLKDLNANKITEIKNQIDQLESQNFAYYNIH